MYKVAVIGCGCIGLATAIEIQNRLGRSAKVTIFADKFTPNTTSDIAAGLWEPYLLGNNKTEDVIRWAQGTYEYILKLWKEGKAKEAGVCLQPIVNLVEAKEYQLPEWLNIALGHSELSARHLESLSKQYNKTFTSGFSFISFTWEGAIFLPYLQKQFVANGGELVQRHIERFEELSEFDVIVNCTGLNARDLSDDIEVTPIRGQIRRVKAPWQYTTYLLDLNDEDSCYIIANTKSVVLGGTKQPSFDTNLNENDKARFIRNLTKLIPSLKDTEVVADLVGLRPYRPLVRLEEEFFKTTHGKILKIVHNYGHGGSGVSLCVGCAKDAAGLVENVLRVNTNKL